MRIRFKSIFLLVLLLAWLSSCKRNHYKIDTSQISVTIEIKRLEKDLFTLDPEKIPASLPVLEKKYGDFLQLFSYVIHAGNIGDSSFNDIMVMFCTDKINNEIYSSVIKHYPDIELIKEGLENAFSHYLWYFPGKKIPGVYTCITGFNNSLIIADSAIGISLDKYLGKDYEHYSRLGIYKYVAARMNSWNIVPDCIYGWGSTEWNFGGMNYSADNTLSEIIHEGKLKYFEKCMLTEISDTLLFGFTPDQMNFCKNNESQMWQYLIEHNLLFSSDQFIIRKLIGEAPFTSYFTNESPGRASVWLGFRIVESYMMRNREISLDSLMKNTDIHGILEKARYSPH